MRKTLNIDHAYLIDVRPFGIFNRFMYDSSSEIYLENGLIDLGNMGFRNPEAYKPCKLYTNADECPINGPIHISEATAIPRDSSNCATAPFLIEKIKYDLLFSSKNRGGIESRIFGCDVKVKSVDMVDPRGEGQDCYTYYQKSYPEIHPMIVPGFGPGGMIEVFLQTTEAWLAQRAKSVSNTVCRKRDASISNYKADEALYCSEEIIFTKYSGREFPGSLFTGKLRLYNQAIQGSPNFNFQAKESGFGFVYEISLKKEENPGEKYRPAGAVGELRPRTYELNPYAHAMYRDSQYNYFLVNTSSWSFTYLEPNKDGRKIRQYLRTSGHTLSKKEVLAYEAYLLSCCLPTRSAASGAQLQFEIGGSPFHFNWHASWNGDRMARVGIGSIQNHAQSALQTVTIDLDTESLFAEELYRKKLNLLRQKYSEDFANGDAWVYCTAASLTPKSDVTEGYDIMDPDSYCVSGDIEDGAWFFKTKVDAQGNSTEGDTKTAEQNNRQYGGFVMSKEFHDTFKDFISLSEDESEGGEFQFRAGKVYSWDSFQGAYYYHNLDYTNPRKPRTFEGDFNVPIYCWFDNNDMLKVVNYYEQGTDNFDNINEVPEGHCFAGFTDVHYQKSFTSGTYFHGFSVSPSGVEDKAYRGYSFESTAKYTGTETPESEMLWEWMCPPVLISCANPELTDWRLEVNPGLGLSCKGDWWGALGKSVSTSEYTSKSDSNSGASFFIVPKSDAESAVFGHMDTITSTKVHNFSVTYGTNNLTMYWCLGLFKDKTKCQYFAPDFDCVGWYYYAFNADRVYFNRIGDVGSWTYDYATGIAANRSVGSATPLMGISDFTDGSWGNYSKWKTKRDCDTRKYNPSMDYADVIYYRGRFTPSDNWLTENVDDHIIIVDDHTSEIVTYYVGTAYLAGKGPTYTIESEHKYTSMGDFGEYYKFAEGPPDPWNDPYIYSHFNVKAGVQEVALVWGSTLNKDKFPLKFPYLKGQVFVGYA